MKFILKILLFSYITTLLLPEVSGAKILFYFGFSTYSHRIAVWPLVEALVDRGHNVTFFSSSPNKNPNPNVQEFIPKSLNSFYGGAGVMNVNFLEIRLKNKLESSWNTVPDFAASLCEAILGSQDTKEWLETSDFDLIFIDQLFNDCAYAFVHKFKAKFIIYGTNSLMMWSYDPYGIVPETSWIPDAVHHYNPDMNLWERIRTTLEALKWHFKRQWYYFPKLEKIIRTELNLTDLPPLWQIDQNISLFFANTHYSDEYARALPPFVIPLGGLHLQASARSKLQSIPPVITQHYVVCA